MITASRLLTYLSAVLMVAGISWSAMAATCSSCLPGSNAIAGWVAVPDSTRAGEMGTKPSFEAYNGAVESMQDQGIRSFAQRIYKHSTTGKMLTVDVYRLCDSDHAKKLFAAKKAGYKRAKPLTNYTSIRDRAFVGTMRTFTFGALQRDEFLCEISMSKASTVKDRGAAKSFVIYMSKKLAPPPKPGT